MEKIREYFWPLLEKAKKEPTITLLNVEDITVDDDNIDIVLDYAMKIYESELGRNAAIETKASLFISSLAIITSVVLAITTTLINKDGFNLILFLLVLVLFFLTIYVLRTVWFAVKVHERRAFNTFYHSDILKNGNKKEYSKQLLASIVNKTKKNALIINSKINNMVMAQEYFKRAIVTLFIYSVLLIVFFVYKCNLGIKHSLVETIKILNIIDFGTWLIILIIAIAIISIIINIILFKKFNNIKN